MLLQDKLYFCIEDGHWYNLKIVGELFTFILGNVRSNCIFLKKSLTERKRDHVLSTGKHMLLQTQAKMLPFKINGKNPKRHFT